ncbi:amino acid adenylation domain-containing protein [Pseudomonas sp. NPDC087598]|uniref:amino acid adenylation domain-containing protein n=1 Tax=Pseudomonas sp. NPDC087598 TaxID=3364440 RepID=UPI00382E0675
MTERQCDIGASNVLDQLRVQVINRPEQLALVDEIDTWSYTELFDHVAALGACIAAQGVSTSGNVGVFFEHRSQAISGILATIHAGKTWVTLDVSHPDAYLREMVQHAEIDLVVTDEALYARATSLLKSDSQIVLCTQKPQQIVEPKEVSSTAYIMYTSGSTGAPKGVFQSHRNLMRQIDIYKNALDISCHDRLSLLPAVGVDAGLMDIFAALTSGATLYVFDVRTTGVEALPAWLNEHEITLYHSTPTLFRGLCAVTPKGVNFPSVRKVVLGGEAAYGTDFLNFKKLFSKDAVLVNGLGPTESTLALQAHYSQKDSVPEGLLSVGKPVEGMEILLVDSLHRAVEDEGELVLCSENLALGYWNDRANNEKAFAKVNHRSQRLYYTGDLARKLDDGSYLHLGRKDNQIKLRGHRIEAAEVESALRRLDGVREAAVVKYRFSTGLESLVAVVTRDDNTPSSTAEMLSQLKLALPPYMLPHNIVTVDSLPLTLSAKIDRLTVLKNLFLEAPTPSISGVGVLTETEDCVLEICRQEIGGWIDIDSNFFAAGGDSLIASRLLSMIRDHFDVQLSLAAFFDALTLRQVSSMIDNSPRQKKVRQHALTAEHSVPLSFSQEQIWASQFLSSGESLYTLVYGFRLEGALDTENLSRAFKMLIERHDCLRIMVTAHDGIPLQTVRDVKRTSVDLNVIESVADLQSVLAEEIAVLASNRMGDIHFALLKPTLISTGPRSHHLLIGLHHLAVDGVAVNILFKDLQSIYAALICGEKTPALAPAKSYVEYISLQRQWMISTDYEQHKKWWSRHLSDLQPLELPGDFSRPQRKTFNAASHRFTLPPETLAELKNTASAYAVTPYVLYLCAFALMLSRCSNQDDFAVASPASGRSSSDTEHMVGTFVNPVLVRIRINEDLMLADFVSEVKRSVALSLEHQKYPVSHLSTTLKVDPEAISSHLFNVMLSVQKRPELRLNPQQIKTDDLRLNQPTVLGDLCLTIYEDGSDIECELEYSKEMFSPDTIARYVDYFSRLLTGIVINRNSRLCGLPMLSDAQVNSLLEYMEPTETRGENPLSVYECYSRYVHSQPDTIAIWSPEGDLTYAQLDAEVSALAQALKGAGVTAGQLIPVVSSESRYVVSAWLAINKMGAGFVPIEANWPETRILDAIRRCETRVVVGAANFHTQPGEDYHVIRLPLHQSAMAMASPIASVQYNGDAPVYGIFTSGSTGTPKLAVIAQRGISNRFDWMSHGLMEGQKPITLQTTSHIYDSSVWQLLWPLTVGGQAFIPTENLAFDVERLLLGIYKYKVNIIDFVPSVFDVVVQQLIKANRPLAELASLRYLILGGESLQGTATKRFTAKYPQVTLLNVYGPTEASIGCIFSNLTNAVPPYPIGRPIPNVTALVLDQRQRLCPPGTTGELYLGGACVGIGYWNDSLMTDASFVTNPYQHVSSAQRLYKTGDEVRLGSDGNFYFLGRRDDQIKIRGVRIQPVEITEKLLQHPAVQEAVVDVRNVDGVASLCAWIRPTVPVDVREHCIGCLPVSMVPEHFIGCEAFPISPSGKLDKKALPAPRVKPMSPVNRSGPRAPAKVIELASLWAEVLSVDESVINYEKNFFEQGGNSLLAIQLLYKLKKRFDIKISIADVFRFNQLETFARQYLGGR